MIVRKYLPKDYGDIEEWYGDWGFIPPRSSSITENCYMIDGVAAGFLIKTDTDICFFEGFVTNPKVESNKRSEALNLLTEKLLGIAKDLGFKEIWVLCKHNSIKQRAERFGFAYHGKFNMLSKGVE